MACFRLVVGEPRLDSHSPCNYPSGTAVAGRASCIVGSDSQYRYIAGSLSHQSPVFVALVLQTSSALRNSRRDLHHVSGRGLHYGLAGTRGGWMSCRSTAPFAAWSGRGRMQQPVGSRSSSMSPLGSASGAIPTTQRGKPPCSESTGS